MGLWNGVAWTRSDRPQALPVNWKKNFKCLFRGDRRAGAGGMRRATTVPPFLKATAAPSRASHHERVQSRGGFDQSRREKDLAFRQTPRGVLS